jgi:hypothetical protein
MSGYSTLNPGQCELVAWDVSRCLPFANEETGYVIPPPVRQHEWWEVDLSIQDIRVVLCEDPRAVGAISRAHRRAGLARKDWEKRHRNAEPRRDDNPRPSRRPKGPPSKHQPQRKQPPKPKEPKRELQPVGVEPPVEEVLMGTGLPIVTPSTVLDLPQAPERNGVTRKPKASVKRRIEIANAHRLVADPIQDLAQLNAAARALAPRPKPAVNSEAMVLSGWHEGTTNVGFFSLYVPKDEAEEIQIALELVMSSFEFKLTQTTLHLSHVYGIADSSGTWYDGSAFVAEMREEVGG